MLCIGIDIGTATAAAAVRREDGEEFVRVIPSGAGSGRALSTWTTVRTADGIYEKLLCEAVHGSDGAADRSATVVLTCRCGLERDPGSAGKMMEEVRSAGERVFGDRSRIDVLCVLPGAASAAVYRYLTGGHGGEETVLVVDFGDSAFRVSAVTVRPDLGYTVLSTRGCADGCGKIRTFAGLLLSEKLYETHGIADGKALGSIKAASGTLMKDLNRRKSATVKIRHGREILPVTVQREEFLDKAAMMYDEQLEVVGTVFGEARDAGHTPDEVILTGGGMLLGAVGKRLCGYLSTLGMTADKVFVPAHPDAADALGAALIASEKRKRRMIGHCYGVTTSPDYSGVNGVLTMIGAGAQLPAVSGELAVNGSAAQTIVTVFRRIDGMTTDISDTRDCTEIRRVAFNIPKDERAWISILLGTDGLITVKARLGGGACLTESFRTDYSC